MIISREAPALTEVHWSPDTDSKDSRLSLSVHDFGNHLLWLFDLGANNDEDNVNVFVISTQTFGDHLL